MATLAASAGTSLLVFDDSRRVIRIALMANGAAAKAMIAGKGIKWSTIATGIHATRVQLQSV